MIDTIHGNLSFDPKPVIERAVTIPIIKKKIQVQHLILAGTSAAVVIGSLLFGEERK